MILIADSSALIALAAGNSLNFIDKLFTNFYIPNGKKIHIQANLAEGNLIKGVTIELNNHISSLIDQIISIPSRLKNQKLAVFQFPTLGKRYTLFGDYVGENIINELSKRGMKVVERGLLTQVRHFMANLG